MTKVLQCQLPPKELNSGNFTLPCTIGNFNFYGMADLGASVNVMPRNIFEYLRLANLRNTNMLVEMADMTKKAPSEIDQLVDEYDLGIGKKGHMLGKIWEYCKDVHRDSTYWWHDHEFEEEERDEKGIEIEKYDPPYVQVETFEVKKYSFKSGQSFVFVTKEVDDVLPLRRKNESRFRELIRKEFDVDAHDET
ncbi:RNA-directed DNA polymerase, eukaryota, reverse transcriptase zinc-binding domain protein [Tanacetum coccineum]